MSKFREKAKDFAGIVPEEYLPQPERGGGPSDENGKEQRKDTHSQDHRLHVLFLIGLACLVFWVVGRPIDDWMKNQRTIYYLNTDPEIIKLTGLAADPETYRVFPETQQVISKRGKSICKMHDARVWDRDNWASRNPEGTIWDLDAYMMIDGDLYHGDPYQAEPFSKQQRQVSRLRWCWAKLWKT